MGICLNMIVKDEAARLPRLLASIEGEVDACVVCDTGSTDATAELISAWAARRKIPCRVVPHGWVDFAFNRNLALQEMSRARDEGLHDCGWVMILDADEALHVDDSGWKRLLKAGRSYSVHVRAGSDSVIRPFLLDVASAAWQWKGRVHNWVERSGADAGFEFLPGVQVRAGGHEGAKSHPFPSAMEKAASDRKLLTEEREGSLLTEARHISPLRWEACYYQALLLKEQGPVAAMSALPLVEAPAPSLDGLFWMEHAIYEWKLPLERALLLYRADRRPEAGSLAESLLGGGLVPEAEAGFLEELLRRIRPVSS